MISTTAIVAGGLVLGSGTFAYRAAGPVLQSRVRVSLPVQQLMSTAATVLLLALCVTSALADGQEWSDPARPAGVLVAGLLAWRRAPFVVIVLAAAATAAGLRLIGV
ncbi:MAG: AzlD domain-containing protein [Nocardioides sp.]|nr:AzlD domain-containing protein [Nocardioides sp.]